MIFSFFRLILLFAFISTCNQCVLAQSLKSDTISITIDCYKLIPNDSIINSSLRVLDQYKETLSNPLSKDYCYMMFFSTEDDTLKISVQDLDAPLFKGTYSGMDAKIWGIFDYEGRSVIIHNVNTGIAQLLFEVEEGPVRFVLEETLEKRGWMNATAELLYVNDKLIEKKLSHRP